MLDIFTRALSHPSDYLGVLRSRKLTFVEKIEETPGTFSFLFQMKEPCTWQAGQHGVFTLPGKNVTGKTWRPFSIASSSHEQIVRISTRISEPHSDFKEQLLQLEPGDTVRLRGPFGEFHASGKTQHIIGIAGGIGITPFRALAYEITHGHLPNTTLTLIYSCPPPVPFQDELNHWQHRTGQLSIVFTQTPEQVTHALQDLHSEHGNDADYFISGSPGMIKALRATCKKLGITKITNDPFKGY